jgi:sugar O-acyltransferase (sialic acid O-acetyltransferase NeuD family)
MTGVRQDSTDRPIVVFGTGPLGRLMHFLFTTDSPRRVEAFAVDGSHRSADSYLDLPVVAFEDVTRDYPPATHDMFVAVGYRRVNRFRAERYEAAKALGYTLPSFISDRASVWPDLEIGDNCLVMDEAVLNPFVRIGNDCIIWSAALVGHESVIGDHCFVSSHAVISGVVTVGSHCFFGSNATVRDTITVAPGTIVGAGAVVTRSTNEGDVLAAAEARLLPIKSDRLPKL